MLCASFLRFRAARRPILHLLRNVAKGSKLQQGISHVFDGVIPKSADSQGSKDELLSGAFKTPLHTAPSTSPSSRSYPRLVNLLGGSGLVDPEVADRSQIPLLQVAERLLYMKNACTRIF